MDAFVLLGSFVVLMLVGMPVAYALGLSALVGAMWMELLASVQHDALQLV